MIIQGSPEWFAQRLGKVTASRVADVVAKTKTGWGASRGNYAAQLIVERLTGQPTESYTNAAMQWGTETEPQARAAYEFFQSVSVAESGFVNHHTISMSGASPDGLVNDDGLLEIKCPQSSTHIETLLGAEIDKKYRLQMQWQLCCTGRMWCDFVSFDPRFPLDLQMKVIRVERDQSLIESLENDVDIFLCEVAEKMEKLKALMGPEETGGQYLIAG